MVGPLWVWLWVKWQERHSGIFWESYGWNKKCLESVGRDLKGIT